MVSLPKVWKQRSNLPVRATALPPLPVRAVLLFDIDGVIRDVTASYRRAIVETVHQFSGWRPEAAQIDALKCEGCWNNDWEASLELLRRHGLAGGQLRGGQPGGHRSSSDPRSREPAPSAVLRGDPGQPATDASAPAGLPAFDTLVAAFSTHYFGGDPEGDPTLWRGFIGQEPLLVGPEFFADLSAAGFLWGFVSGAEPPSVRYLLQERLGLADPPVIAMGEAPDKPDPTGLLQLAATLLATCGANPAGGSTDNITLGREAPPVAYLGDTITDVQTVLRARERMPDQRFLSLAVSPPHLQGPGQKERRRVYEQQLRAAGADRILERSDQAGAALEALLG
ncbi:MAG: TIGR01548 family HAD-type hydrolase [Synechococcaceae cyanobacterium ELA263]